MPFLESAHATVLKPATNDSKQSKMMHNEEKRDSMGLVKKAVMQIEQRTCQAMEGIELETDMPIARSPNSSAEVSPTESGTATPKPRLTIAPCPARLTSFHPPKNFGAVEAGIIYRSGFPEEHNIEFLELLKIRTMLTLVETEAEPEVQMYTSLNSINHVVVPIVANKEGEVRSTHDSLCEALLIAMDPRNYPLHIHCNRGKHRTGCVVACLRKIQRWPIEEVLAEYDTYSSPKARPEDIELIKSFESASVFEYAKEQGMVESWPRESRVDSATDIWELAEALPPHYLTPSTISEASVDEDLLMSGAMIPATTSTYSLDSSDSAKSASPDRSGDDGPEVTIAEVDEDVSMD